VLRGRVVGEDGRPIPEAAVEPFGFSKGQGGHYGGLKGFDPLALTNGKGEFRLGVPEKGLTVHVQLSAPRLCRRVVLGLVPGKDNEVTLLLGVTVVGRVVKDGRPLAGVAVGLAQKDRNVEKFVGEFRAATDAQGVFRIPNVPPQDVLVVYGEMVGLKAHGAIPAREVRTGASASQLDAGDLAVTPGFRLTGRVVLADGKPVPAGTRVMISREEAWDSQQAEADPGGNFRVTGLPPERYSLHANVPGYRASPKNASYDLLNGLGLLGKVTADTDGLRLLLEPGEWAGSPNFDQERMREYERRRDAPLRGAPEEAAPRR
jgi:hypothetical protein